MEMNYKHIEALLRHAGRVRCVEHNGRMLLTEGHFACECPNYTGETEQFEKLASSWASWESTKALPSMVDEQVTKETNFCRKIGPAYINEAFYRALDGPGFTWTATGSESVILVHFQDKLMAAVMPLLYQRSGTPCNPTDAEVFESFSSEANDYYLSGGKVLAKEVADLEDEIEQKENWKDELETEIDMMNREVQRKRERLKRLAAQVPA